MNAMVLNVLDLVPDVLTYLSKLRNQSVFNFCAIPQVMAIATLALVFNNLDVYQRNVKIRKGEAVKLILNCSDMPKVITIFRHYIHIISKKNEANDPNFMAISIAIGKVRKIKIIMFIGIRLTFFPRSNNGLLQMLRRANWLLQRLPIRCHLYCPSSYA